MLSRLRIELIPTHNVVRIEDTALSEVLLCALDVWYDLDFLLFQFSTRYAHMVHIVNQIRFKMVYTS